MKIWLFALAALVLACTAFPMAAEGGNVSDTNIFFSDNATSFWSGIVGGRDFFGPFYAAFSVSPDEIGRLNVSFSAVNCSYSSISLFVIASSAPNFTLPLSPGNLTELDAFVSDQYNGTATFTQRANISLSFGRIINVPYTMTCGSNCTASLFPTYYLQDALGNFVFAGAVVPGASGAFGPADYQMILPTNGSNMTYYVTTDINYTCVSEKPEEGRPTAARHSLYIYPIDTMIITIGDSANITVSVRNTGSGKEFGIDVSAEGEAFSTHYGIPMLDVGNIYSNDITITPYKAGNITLNAIARNNNAVANRIFNIIVFPQCVGDGNCSFSQFCESPLCMNKRADGARCTAPNQCINGVCSHGICGGCVRDYECSESQICIAGTCADLRGGECGFFSNHSFVQYSCCNSSECGPMMDCSGHRCTEKEFFIRQDTVPLENTTVSIRIVDRDGMPIPGLLINGKWTTDWNGYVTIIAPRDGNICAEFGDETRCKRMNVTLLGIISAEGLLIEGRSFYIIIKDSIGGPVSGANVSFEGNGIGNTDGSGRIPIMIPHSGNFTIGAKKAGYLIASAIIEVTPAANVCDLPFKAYPLIQVTDRYWILLLAASLALLAASFMILWKRLGKGMWVSLLYDILPLSIFYAMGEMVCGLLSLSFIFLVPAALVQWIILEHVAGRQSEMKKANKGGERGL